MVLTIAAFILTFSIILSITIEDTHLQEKQPYVPKRLRPHKSTWIKSMIKLLMGCAEPLVSTINKLKVCRRRHTRGARRVGPRHFKYKTVPPQVPRDLSSPKSIPVMTTTWSNGTSDIPPGRQFDSDSQALMLDDGASACITNDTRFHRAANQSEPQGQRN